MTVAFACPGCGYRFERPASLAGRRARCTYCKREFRIPKPNPEAAWEPEPVRAEAISPPSASGDFELVDEPAVLDPSRLNSPGVVSERPPARSRFRGPESSAGGTGKSKAKARPPAGEKVRSGVRRGSLDGPMFRRLVAGGLALVVAFLACKAAYTSIARSFGWITEEAPAEPTMADLPIRDDVIARHGPLMKQVADAWADMADLYAGVHNLGDLQTAAPKFEAIGTRMESAAKQAKTLPSPNSAEQKTLLDTYGPTTEAALNRILAEVQRIQQIPELADGDFEAVIQVVTSAQNDIRVDRQRYEQMLRDSHYAEVVVTNLPTPEAQAIVSRKLHAIAQRAASQGVSANTRVDGNTGTLTARYTPITDPKVLADAIDFGRVTVSGRKITVVARELSAVELEAERKSNSPTGKFARTLDGLRSKDQGERDQALRLLGDVNREEPQALRDNAAVLATALSSVVQEGEGFVVNDAVKLLSEINAPEAVPPLLKALASERPEVRAQAARAVESMAAEAKRRGPLEASHAEVVEALVGRMSDPDPGVRGAATNAFRSLGWPELVPSMVEALGARDVEGRGAAIQVLLTLLREKREVVEAEKPAILKAIAGLGETGPHPYGHEVVGFLNESGWPEVAPTLAALIRSKDRPFRDTFLRMVFDTGRDRPERLDANHVDLVHAMAKVLEDREGGARGDVARFLAASNWPEAMPALLQGLPGSMAPEGREEVFHVLGDLARNQPDRLAGHRDAVLDALGQVVGLEDQRSWRAMLEFTRALKWPESVPILLQALHPRDLELRREAFNHLREACREQPEPFKERRGEVAAALAGTLGEPDRNLRGEIAVLLLGYAGPDDIPALAEFLKGEDGSGRHEVMQYLARTEDERAARAIAAWLPRDAGAALGCLVAMGKVAEPATVEALASRDGEVRRHAALALKVIGTGKSVRALQRVAQDPDGGVAGAAQEALQAIEARGGR